MLPRLRLYLLLCFIGVGTSGCIGTVVGQTADAAIEVAKVPFKVGGAVVDLATGDDDEEKKDN